MWGRRTRNHGLLLAWGTEQLGSGLDGAIGRTTDARLRARGEQRLVGRFGQRLDATELVRRGRDLREVLDKLEAKQRGLAVLAPRDHAVIAKDHRIDEFAPRRERLLGGIAG